MQEQIAELLKQPYSRVLIPEEEGGYSAFVLEFPGCVSAGDTADEAMENLTEAMKMWIEAVIEEGQNVPDPAEAAEYSGRLNLRMPETLHRDATVRAQIDGVSLNQWFVSAISRAVGAADTLSAAGNLRDVLRDAVRDAVRDSVRDAVRDAMSPTGFPIVIPQGDTRLIGDEPLGLPEPQGESSTGPGPFITLLKPASTKEVK